MAMQKLFIDRIYHPYWDWEEMDYNMWGTVKDRKKYLKLAVEFTGDHLLYGRWMMKVAGKWQKSCEHNLTGRDSNNRAWIGHAACAMAHGIPEDIVREAWGLLSEEQQIKANNKADMAINYWKESNKDRLQCQK